MKAGTCPGFVASAASSGTMPRTRKHIAEAGLMETIRWGIVGAGRIAQRFAESLQHVEGAALAGVWSRRAEPARALASPFGARAFDDFDTLLAHIDALYIATMQDSHPHYALRAFAAGKPV